MYLLEVINKAAKEVRDERASKSAKKTKWRLAKDFNRLYTYRGHYFQPTGRLPGTAMFGDPPEDVAAWMCPGCNAVHRPVSCSVFSGLQFPACCNFQEGHRLGDVFATVT